MNKQKEIGGTPTQSYSRSVVLKLQDEQETLAATNNLRTFPLD